MAERPKPTGVETLEKTRNVSVVAAPILFILGFPGLAAVALMTGAASQGGKMGIEYFNKPAKAT